MKKLINDPANVVAETLAGFQAAHADLVTVHFDPDYVVRADAPVKGKVGLVSGGGSGGLATVYVDGAPIPERHLNTTPLDLWDVAQVEILRGPQSTLQGRNALAGAIVIRTQDPTFDWTGRARVLMAEADERVFSFAGGGPIIVDQLAFRVSIEDRKSDGHTYNITRQANEAPSDSTTVRAMSSEASIVSTASNNCSLSSCMSRL